MWRAERHQRIRALLAAFGQVGIDRIVTELDVSRETVRRDLKEMEETGLLRRVHGGIVPAQGESEAPFAVRAQLNLREKRAIAERSLRLVSPGQTILIDAGSTTACLAQSLAGLSGLLVFTNSVDVAAHLGTASSLARQNRVILLGGDYVAAPPSTRGMSTLAAIHSVQADLAFSSPFGLTPEDGASSFVPEEAEIARAMFARATTRVLLADHSKLGQRGRVSFAAPETIHHIVMDADAAGSVHFAPLHQVAAPQLILAR